MKRVTRLFIVLLLAAVLSLFCHATEHDGYIVKLCEDTFVPLSLDGMEKLSLFEDTYAVDEDTFEELFAVGAIESFEPNYIFEELSYPNDTYYSFQWTLDAINFESSYPLYNGSGITVAVLDSGLDTTHSEFNGISLSPYSVNMLGTGGHTDAFYRDQSGHGTFVASQIAPKTNNSNGIAGISYEAELMVVRCVSASTSEKYPYDADYDSGSATLSSIVNSIVYAADNGADVINMSLGTTTYSDRLEATVDYAISKGIIFVAAAGNKGDSTLYYPANNDGVIGVGSVSQSEGVISHSYFSDYNESVDVCAPGGAVAGILVYPNDDGVWYTTEAQSYMYSNGTSFASPVVAAVAAIVKQVNTELDAEDFLSLIKVTSTDYGDVGYDVYYGYGLVNLEELIYALTEAEYDIFYSLSEGESLDSGYADSYKLNRGSALALPTPKKEGYSFVGWHTASDLTDESFLTLELGALGEASESDGVYSIAPITLYPEWEEEREIAIQLFEGDEYEYVLSYANGKAFEMYDVDLTATLGALPTGEYIYKVVNGYLVLTGAIEESGTYVISDVALLLYGDADGSGEITLIDVLRIMKYTIDSEVDLDIAADVSLDGQITVIDVLKALETVLNQ